LLFLASAPVGDSLGLTRSNSTPTRGVNSLAPLVGELSSDSETERWSNPAPKPTEPSAAPAHGVTVGATISRPRADVGIRPYNKYLISPKPSTPSAVGASAPTAPVGESLGLCPRRSRTGLYKAKTNNPSAVGASAPTARSTRCCGGGSSVHAPQPPLLYIIRYIIRPSHVPARPPACYPRRHIRPLRFAPHPPASSQIRPTKFSNRAAEKLVIHRFLKIYSSFCIFIRPNARFFTKNPAKLVPKPAERGCFG